MYLRSMGNQQAAETTGSIAVFAAVLFGVSYFMFPDIFREKKKPSRKKPRRRVMKRRRLPG